MRACERMFDVRLLITSATTSITAKVTRYCVSDTAKLKYGGTKKKSNAATPNTEARIEGPRPNRIAASITPSRYTMTRLVSSSQPDISHAMAVQTAAITAANR